MRRTPYLWLSPVLIALACNGGDDNAPSASGDGTDDDGINVDGSGTSGGTSADDTGGTGGSGGGGGGGGGGEGDTTVGGVDATGDATKGGADGTDGDDSGGNDEGDTGEVELPPKPKDPPGTEAGACQPGALRYCWTGAPTTYEVGECAPGLQECAAVDLDIGTWGPCADETLPDIEVCDGLDNDCDGDVDEGQGITTCGMGICEHDEPNCIDGVPNTCDPDSGASFEVCNEIDDDCDGNIDEGLGEDVVACGLGACHHTVSDCADGELPECDPLEGASMEVCDGIDNDCDGDVDEDIPDISCGMFDCEVTIPGCIGGSVPTCEPLPPQNEICDGNDNDCDGLTDEDQGTWTCGDFECAVTVPRCVDGEPQPESSCEPIPGGAEICGNGIDDNCDGQDPPCAETYLVGTDTVSRPIDIIWMIDSSGSMADEIATVESEINAFASALDAAGGDNRLHLIADRGGGEFEMCVLPPLGGPGCSDTVRFRHYDTNGGGEAMVHSSNAIGRVIQQHAAGWGTNLLPNSFLAFIVTTDDDGDDYLWVSPDDEEPTDDCQSDAPPSGAENIINSTRGNNCRHDLGGNTYTSLAEDFSPSAGVTYLGFESFMTNTFPTYVPGEDWAWYSIIGATGTDVLGVGHPDNFNGCATSVEDGDEYVKLSLLTGTTADMIDICDAPPWDLDELATAIAENAPNDTYVLDGNPDGNCLAINPATIQVVVNGVPMAAADWSYDAPSCTVTVDDNVPTVGDNVVVVYENF